MNRKNRHIFSCRFHTALCQHHNALKGGAGRDKLADTGEYFIS